VTENAVLEKDVLFVLMYSAITVTLLTNSLQVAVEGCVITFKILPLCHRYVMVFLLSFIKKL